MISKNTLVRLKTIDSCLCRRQKLWTLEDLRQACEDALYEYEGITSVSIRTIQRDIELMRSDKLGYNAPIVVKDKKYYIYEDPDYSITRLPLSKRDLESTPELVTLRVTQAHAPYLLTKPLHDSQQLIKKEDNGSIVISLNVIINHELEGKILALGAFVEVLAPRRLRQSIATQILMAASQYSNQIQ